MLVMDLKKHLKRDIIAKLFQKPSIIVDFDREWILKQMNGHFF